VPPEDAEIGSRALVASDLWGVESHGAPRLHLYAHSLHLRGINPAPNIEVVRDKGISAVLDGDNGWGMVLGTKAMNLAIEKARTHGLGLVALSRTNHFGMSGYYASLTLEYDLVGFAATNTPPTMVPTYARIPGIGTNPFAVAIPAGDEPPFLLDMSCTAVALGKLQIAQRRGKPMPSGWSNDPSGEGFTHDLDEALAAFRLAPLGGMTETGGHKGYGLSVV
ncbi:unnamed protein product, partial [marine sediment metagenome]